MNIITVDAFLAIGFVDRLALESVASSIMTGVFSVKIEDCTRQEAKRWPGAVLPEKHRSGSTAGIERTAGIAFGHARPGSAATPVEPLKRVARIMPVARPKPTHDDWVKTVLFDRGYLLASPAMPSKSIWQSSRPAVVFPTVASRSA